MATITHTSTDPETGHELAHYESGAIYDKTASRLAAGPTDPALNPVIRDPAGMVQRRREIAEQAAWDTANQKAIELIESGQLAFISMDKIAGGAPVISAVTAKLTELILLGKTGREIEGILPIWQRLIGLGTKIEMENNHTHILDETTHEALTTLIETMNDVMRKRDAVTEGVIIISDENHVTP